MNHTQQAALELIRERQVKWARDAGVIPDSNGYVADLAANLFQPLGAPTAVEFASGSGNETGKGAGAAKMQALHSSSALACNVFDYWRGRDLSVITRALGTPSPVKALWFERQCRTPLGGTPPNLDLLLELEDGSIIGVESKFTEPYTPRKKRAPFAASYFEDDRRLWTDAGLAGCQRLASALNSGQVRFEYLDAPQLLKHALGLWTAYKSKAALWYFWYDVEGEAGSAHRAEIQQFSNLVGNELHFMSQTYQDIIRAIRFASSRTSDGTEHLDYITARYVGTAHGV